MPLGLRGYTVRGTIGGQCSESRQRIREIGLGHWTADPLSERGTGWPTSDPNVFVRDGAVGHKTPSRTASGWGGGRPPRGFASRCEDPPIIATHFFKKVLNMLSMLCTSEPYFELTVADR
jgi:hypothetical protein